MKDFSLSARAYIIGTLLIGCALWGWNVSHIQTQDLLALAILSALASLALIVKVVGATNRLHYNISFIIYAFTLITFGVPAAMLVILISNIVEWIFRKYPWYIQSFNIASYFIVLHLTGLVYDQFYTDHLLADPVNILWLILSMAFFTLLNHLMVGMVIWLARGENFAKSGVFSLLALMIDFTMLVMGAFAALVWSVNPIASILTLIPLYLIYNTLRVPALERQSEMDAKTGVYNARYFAREMEAELKRANRFNRPLTVVMADLDLLRNINNTYGHLAGDQVLIGVAQIIKNSVREYDVVARFGGEEFVILMPETSPQDVFDRIESIRQAIEEAKFNVPTSLNPIKATMSFGIAGRDIDGQTANEIIHNADAALYQSKLKGRNRTYVYSAQEAESFAPSTHPDIVPISTSLENRLADNQYTYQPNPFREQATEKAGIPRGNATAPPVTELKKDSQKMAEEKKADPKPVGMVKPVPDWMINLHIAGLSLVALVLFVMLYKFSVGVDWLGIGIFGAIVILTEWFSVEIYARDTSVSTSAVPIVAGTLLFGPVGAILMSLLFALVTLIKHKSRLNRFFFNASNQLIAGLLYTGIYLLAGIPFASQPVFGQILLSLLSTLIVFMYTTAQVSIVMAMSMGARVASVWKDKFSWLSPYYLSMGLIVAALIFSYQAMGYLGIAAVLVPLFLLRYGQTQYIGRTRLIVNQLRENNQVLENKNQEIGMLNEGLLNALAEIIDMRDPYVLGHSKQVARYAVMIATNVGLSSQQVETIRKASLLHDIGKVGIPEKILWKPSSLEREEYEFVKAHPTLGARILESSHSFNELIPIVKYHHERYDGKGYPAGLRGDEIPIEARIVALADAVEAMASDRAYRKAMTYPQIIEEITRNSGSQFDPLIVDAFLRSVRLEGVALIDHFAPSQPVRDLDPALQS